MSKHMISYSDNVSRNSPHLIGKVKLRGDYEIVLSRIRLKWINDEAKPSAKITPLINQAAKSLIVSDKTSTKTDLDKLTEERLSSPKCNFNTPSGKKAVQLSSNEKQPFKEEEESNINSFQQHQCSSSWFSDAIWSPFQDYTYSSTSKKISDAPAAVEKRNAWNLTLPALSAEGFFVPKLFRLLSSLVFQDSHNTHFEYATPMFPTPKCAYGASCLLVPSVSFLFNIFDKYCFEYKDVFNSALTNSIALSSPTRTIQHDITNSEITFQSHCNLNETKLLQNTSTILQERFLDECRHGYDTNDINVLNSLVKPRILLYGGVTTPHTATRDLIETSPYSLFLVVKQNDSDKQSLEMTYRLDKAKCNLLKWNPTTGIGGRLLSSELWSPNDRYGASSVMYQGRMYMFGGIGRINNNNATATTLMNDVWVLYPTSTNDHHDNNSSSKHIKGKRRYEWKELPLKHPNNKPPPCAFHLSTTCNGYMYILISNLIIGETFNDHLRWINKHVLGEQILMANKKSILAKNKDIERSIIMNRGLRLRKGVLNAYRRRLERSTHKNLVNELWRLDLESSYPDWEKLEFHTTATTTTTVDENFNSLQGGLAMASYNNRIYCYGLLNGSLQFAIGVFDTSLQLWIAWIKIPTSKAPILCIAAVPIGKLWFLLGSDIWGIFNFVTLEWTSGPKPRKAVMRYGCMSIWLPPYIQNCCFTKTLLKKTITKSVYDIELPIQSFDLAQSYLTFLEQHDGYRYAANHKHTILLIGGFNSHGQICNEISRIVIKLPMDMSKSCFICVSPHNDNLRKQMLGPNLIYERQYDCRIQGTAKRIICALIADELEDVRQQLNHLFVNRLRNNDANDEKKIIYVD